MGNNNIVPIAFAFGYDWMLPACVCISSLLANADVDTFYDIFILHSPDDKLDKTALARISEEYGNCRIEYRKVDHVFDKSYEIRGIKTMAYYRLLIPELIPEYDIILYSDVDVIFRKDLYSFYSNLNLENCYIAGVNSLALYDNDLKRYYEKDLHISAEGIIYSGNIVLNSKKIREDGLVDRFREMAMMKFKFQDMDILNIVCAGHIKYLEPSLCVTTYFMHYAIKRNDILLKYWENREIEEALKYGIVHFNGQKPWKGYCVNFDIWWEYYRKSPFFDEKFYFDFFYSRLNEYDLLPLWKRIKILLRYFVYGHKAM